MGAQSQGSNKFGPGTPGNVIQKLSYITYLRTVLARWTLRGSSTWRIGRQWRRTCQVTHLAHQEYDRVEASITDRLRDHAPHLNKYSIGTYFRSGPHRQSMGFLEFQSGWDLTFIMLGLNFKQVGTNSVLVSCHMSWFWVLNRGGASGYDRL